MEKICTECSLHKTAIRIRVPAEVRKINPALLIVGMAPGREEDLHNYPFVESAPAGGLLRKIVKELELPLEEVAFTNIAHCFPIDDKGGMRDPTEEEMTLCSTKWLWNEISAINPKIIVTLGATASNFLVKQGRYITKYRGRFFDLTLPPPFCKTYSVVPTIHPSAVVRGERKDWLNFLKDDIRTAYRYATIPRTMLVKWLLLNDTDTAIQTIDKAISLYRNGHIKHVSLDIETNNPLGLDKDSDAVDHSLYDEQYKILGYGLAWDDNFGVFIPLYHPGSKVDVVAVLAATKRLLETVPLNGHNLKFDESWFLAKHGITCTTASDTMLKSYALYTVLRRHGLKGLLSDIFKWPPYDVPLWKIISSLPVEQQRFSQIPLELLAEYCVYDTVGTHMLANYFDPLLEKEGLTETVGMLARFSDFYRNLEVRGATVDMIQLSDYEEGYKLLRSNALKLIENLPSVKKFIESRKDKPEERFNPNSTPQVRSVLFDQNYLGLPIQDERTGRGELAISEAVQHKLIKNVMHYHFYPDKESEVYECPYCGPVPTTFKMHPKPGRAEALDFLLNVRLMRKTGKIISYFNGFRSHLRPKKDDVKKLATVSYNHKLHWTKTGRIQSSDMSIHTIPWHADPRRLVVSPWIREGGLILSADYSQMELRVLASLAKDPGLIRAYEEGKDVHVYIASRVWRKEESEITTTLRRYSKTISFGIVFGEGAATIAEQTGMTEAEAEAAINRFLYEEFKGVGAFIEAQHKYAKEHGYVRTPFGRILHIPEIKGQDKVIIAEGERKAQNAPVQSSASDITVNAAILATQAYKEAKLQSFIWAVVHDATECAIYPGELMPILPLHKNAMEVKAKPPWMLVPLVIDYEVGARWDAACKITAFGPNWLTVQGPIRFYAELLSTLRKHTTAYVAEYVEKPRKLFEELIPKRAYEGDNGGDIEVKATIEV